VSRLTRSDPDSASQSRTLNRCRHESVPFSKMRYELKRSYVSRSRTATASAPPGPSNPSASTPPKESGHSSRGAIYATAGVCSDSTRSSEQQQPANDSNRATSTKYSAGCHTQAPDPEVNWNEDSSRVIGPHDTGAVRCNSAVQEHSRTHSIVRAERPHLRCTPAQPAAGRGCPIVRVAAGSRLAVRGLRGAPRSPSPTPDPDSRPSSATRSRRSHPGTLNAGSGAD
jgi:hypothetical protein